VRVLAVTSFELTMLRAAKKSAALDVSAGLGSRREVGLYPRQERSRRPVQVRDLPACAGLTAMNGKVSTLRPPTR
jgi:hypothetical protein